MLQGIKDTIFQRCPECKKGKLFNKVVTLNKKCPHCNITYPQGDLADGPAYIVTCILLFIFAPFLIMFEFKYGYSWLTYLIVILPISAMLLLVSLRLAKAGMVVFEHSVSQGNK